MVKCLFHLMAIADSKHATTIDVKAVIDEVDYRLMKNIHPSGGYHVLWKIKEQYKDKLTKLEEVNSYDKINTV